MDTGNGLRVVFALILGILFIAAAITGKAGSIIAAFVDTQALG